MTTASECVQSLVEDIKDARNKQFLRPVVDAALIQIGFEEEETKVALNNFFVPRTLQ